MLNRVKTSLSVFLLSLAALSLPGCTGTKIIDSWRDEAYTGRPAKIIVLATLRERGPRTLMEEEVTRQLKARGVKPYLGTTLFPEEGLPTKEAIIAKAGELKADAVLVVRYLKSVTGETATPARRYAVPAGFDTSWSEYSGAMYSAVSIRDATYDFYYAAIETTLFDARTKDPLWSVYTSTKYEDHVLKQIRPFTATIMGELEKAKLLPRR